MHQRPIYRMFETSVRRVCDVTPHMRRVTLHGADLSNFHSDLPGQWVKLFFDESGAGRAFTIRHWRPELWEIDIDFARHEHDQGLASTWSAQATTGLPVRLAGPRSNFRHAPGRRLCLFGDETALPAISAIVESLPASERAVVAVEINESTARQQVGTAAQVEWSWIFADRVVPGKQLNRHAREAVVELENDQIWIGCECSAMREMRYAFGRAGFDKKWLHASGYWMQGAVEHVDADSDY